MARVRHSITRVTRDYITVASVNKFEAHYATAGLIARELGVASHLVPRQLRAAGHLPSEAPRGTRPIYRLREIATTLETLKNIKHRTT